MTNVDRVRSRFNVEPYAWGEACTAWPFLETQELRIVLESVPPGSGEVLHVHERAHQFFFVLSGSATMELGGDVVEFGEHEGCPVEPGVPHRIRNDGDEDLVFLVVSAPTTVGDRIPSGAR